MASEDRTDGRESAGPGWLRPLRWVALLLTALVLNAIWEYAQLPLYEGDGDLPTRIMLEAIATDGALITGAAVIAALVGSRTGPATRWLVLIVGLAGTAAFIEIRAITQGRWAYSAAMPTVGIVGLSPLLQLPLTGAVSAAVSRPWPRPGGRD